MTSPIARKNQLFYYRDAMKSSLRLLATLSVLIGAMGLGTTLASANHSWGGYHWARTANPFVLQLGDNLSATWKPYLQTSSTDWSVSTVLDTTVVAGAAGKNCKPKVGRTEICNNRYGRNGWLGIASIWISGSHITQGTVKLNDTYFNTSAYNTSAWRSLVMCQEVGHTFGLDHQDEVFNNSNLNTCMDYTNNPQSNQHPNAHDYEMLDIVYAHLDTSTTLAKLSASSAAAVEDSDDPRMWGREVWRSPDGRASMFTQDLGHGDTLLRHILWAEPQEPIRPERPERARALPRE